MIKDNIFSMGSILAGLFSVPNIQGKQYAPGWQPNDPGNSSTPGWNGGNTFNPIPWPNTVPTLNMLANDPGTPRARAVQSDVNRYAPLPENFLFIAGFTGKSQG